MNPQDGKNSNEFDLTYFKVVDEGIDPQMSMEGVEYAYVYATVNKMFERSEVEQHKLLDSSHQVKKMNKASRLFIFADKSESLEGPPFIAVQQGCKSMCDVIFKEKVFEKVNFIWYNDQLKTSEHTDHNTLLNVIKNEEVLGGTNFNNCFEYVINQIKTMEDSTNVQIMFLTDGDGKCDKMQYFREFLKQVEMERGIVSTIYCLGVTQFHDANLLNFLALAGSNIGNFIYIETKDIMEYMINNTVSDKELNEKLRQSFGECFEQAQSDITSKEHFIVSSATAQFQRIKLSYAIEYTYPENIDDVEITTNNWSHMTYTSSFLISE